MSSADPTVGKAVAGWLGENFIALLAVAMSGFSLWLHQRYRTKDKFNALVTAKEGRTYKEELDQQIAMASVSVTVFNGGTQEIVPYFCEVCGLGPKHPILGGVIPDNWRDIPKRDSIARLAVNLVGENPQKGAGLKCLEGGSSEGGGQIEPQRERSYLLGNSFFMDSALTSERDFVVLVWLKGRSKPIRATVERPRNIPPIGEVNRETGYG